MVHHVPLARSFGFFLVALVAFALNAFLWLLVLSGNARWFSLLAGVAGLVSIYMGVSGLFMRRKRPLQVNDHVLSFYRGRHEITIERRRIRRIFYNTRGLDKRVTVETSDGKNVDIPSVYGLAGLAKKLSAHLQLET